MPPTTRTQVLLVIIKEVANPGWHDSRFNGLMNTANSAGLGAQNVDGNTGWVLPPKRAVGPQS